MLYEVITEVVKRAIAWFAENHVAANLLMFVLVAGGLSSLPAIHQKVFPDINVEVISVGVPSYNFV